VVENAVVGWKRRGWKRWTPKETQPADGATGI
jgi:hypothetical protein